MTPSERFQSWLKLEIVPLLAAHGYRREGRLKFRRSRDGVSNVIFFFSRPRPDPDIYEFTIELSVWSARLAHHAEGTDWAALDEHLSWRLGSLMKGHVDRWWRWRRDMMAVEGEVFGATIRDALESTAIPWLDRFENDEVVRDWLWETFDLLGVTGLRNLHWLVEDIGPAESIPLIEARQEYLVRDLPIRPWMPRPRSEA